MSHETTEVICECEAYGVFNVPLEGTRLIKCPNCNSVIELNSDGEFTIVHKD